MMDKSRLAAQVRLLQEIARVEAQGANTWNDGGNTAGPIGPIGPVGPAGADFKINRKSGLIYSSGDYTAGSNGVITLNRLYVTPFYIGNTPDIFDRINIISIGVAGSFVRVGIYADNLGVPSNLIVDAGQINCSGPGDVYATINQPLTGLVWIASVGQGVAPSVSRIGGSYSPYIGSTGYYSGGPAVGYYLDGISGSLPASWGIVYNQASVNVVPQTYLRKA